tara:strand:- start:259 stop:456 length:198 start_codon:yes stop_codon:yes gene_type:complete
MKKNYITVLDYEVGEVFQYEIEVKNLSAKYEFDYEKFITDKGHKLSNISWMEHSESTIRIMYYKN